MRPRDASRRARFSARLDGRQGARRRALRGAGPPGGREEQGNEKDGTETDEAQLLTNRGDRLPEPEGPESLQSDVAPHDRRGNAAGGAEAPELDDRERTEERRHKPAHIREPSE